MFGFPEMLVNSHRRLLTVFIKICSVSSQIQGTNTAQKTRWVRKISCLRNIRYKLQSAIPGITKNFVVIAHQYENRINTENEKLKKQTNSKKKKNKEESCEYYDSFYLS